MMRAGSGLVAGLAALLFASCSPQAAEAPAAQAAATPEAATTHPVSGLEIIPVTLATDSGKHVIKAEVAVTQRDQAKGLMFRTEMGADEGMLFDYSDAPGLQRFWMKNTVLPLDLIFISPDGRVVNIIANAVPYSTDPLPSTGISAAVLELNGGRAAELGLKPGDRVSW